MAKESIKAPRKAAVAAAAVIPKETVEGEYVVQQKAPARVAGRRVKPGDVLTLTEYQARAELQQGHILLKPATEQDAK